MSCLPAVAAKPDTVNWSTYIIEFCPSLIGLRLSLAERCRLSENAELAFITMMYFLLRNTSASFF